MTEGQKNQRIVEQVKTSARFGQAGEAKARWMQAIKAMGKAALCQIHQNKVFNLQKLQSADTEIELFNKKCRHCLRIKNDLIGKMTESTNNKESQIDG